MTYDWVNDFIGLQWEPNGRGEKGFDCWGLIREVFIRQRDFVLPDWQVDEYSKNAAKRALTRGLTGAELENLVEPVTDPQDYDIAMLSRQRTCFHVGVVINGGILHINNTSNGSQFDRINDFKLYGGDLRFFRWRR